MVAVDLSRVRALKLSAGLLPLYLNNLLVRAHNQVHLKPKNRFSDAGHFFWVTFPNEVKQSLVYVVIAFLLFMVPLLVCYYQARQDINFAHMEIVSGHPLVPEEIWSVLENHNMWTESIDGVNPIASSEIATNNIRVAILGFALGVTCGLGTAAVLIINGMLIGTIFGVCQHFGMAHRLLSFVAPHGALELTAIFISGAAGLIIGKALVFPGQYRRLDALRSASYRAVGLFAGCLPILLIAGLIEGYLSPSQALTRKLNICCVWPPAPACISTYFFLAVQILNFHIE